jgi:hypothetical protein
MVTRLAVVGACLVAGGLLFNVSGYGKMVALLGAVALLISGVRWLARDRNSSARR